MSEDKTKAVQMVTHLVEKLQALPAEEITHENLMKLGLVDNAGLGQTPTFNTTPLDKDYSYSPSEVFTESSTKVEIADLPDGTKRIDVELNYRSASGEMQSVKTGTFVGSFR